LLNFLFDERKSSNRLVGGAIQSIELLNRRAAAKKHIFFSDFVFHRLV